MLHLDIHQHFQKHPPYFNLDINLSISNNARRVVFFGPSGSGKSLTMQAIAGLFQPAGLIIVNGELFLDTARNICLAPQLRHVGYMPQPYALFPHLSVMQNVAYARSGLLGRLVSAKEKSRIHDLLARFKIADLAGRLPAELSGGQKQRAALARAINSSPHILLLDEPFGALDPLLRDEMRRETLAILTEFAIPAIIISHDPEDVDAFTGELVLFTAGTAGIVQNWQAVRAACPTAAQALRLLAASPFRSCGHQLLE